MDNSHRSSAQKQFNERVKENICELGMDEDDAVELAIEHLVAQEVSVTDIIPDVWVVKHEDPISVFCDKYNQIPFATIIGKGFNVSECLEKMKRATEMANMRMNYKLYAGDCMMDVIILSLAKMKNADEDIIRVCLECLLQLYTGYPDPMTEDKIDGLLQIHKTSDDAIRRLVVDIFKECCSTHEKNKQILESKMDFNDNLGAAIVSKPREVPTPDLGLFSKLTMDNGDFEETGEAQMRAEDQV